MGYDYYSLDDIKRAATIGFNTTEPTEIRDGIEFGNNWERCARCGSSAFFETCEWCGGDGWVDSDDWEDFPDEGGGPMRPCPECQDGGGWWCCVSSRDWCEAHPLSGREGIESTANTHAGGTE